MSDEKVLELEKKVNELKNQATVANSQISSHAEVISSLMAENLNLRTNFKLSQQYCQDSQKLAQSLQAQVDSLNRDLDKAKKELADMMSQPAECEESAAA